jgi:hypothetical protein
VTSSEHVARVRQPAIADTSTAGIGSGLSDAIYVPQCSGLGTEQSAVARCSRVVRRARLDRAQAQGHRHTALAGVTPALTGDLIAMGAVALGPVPVSWAQGGMRTRAS